MRKEHLHSTTVSGKIFFFLVLSLFLAEQISSYHFPVGENIEVTDSEEGEQETDQSEKEKKEFVSEAYYPNSSILKEQNKLENIHLSKVLVIHFEVFTPPPKS